MHKMWLNEASARDACRLIKQPNIHSLVIFHENLCAIELKVQKYSKLIQIGFCVLELSKHFMYDLYYNYFKSKYHDAISLQYFDTDGMIVHIFTANFYADERGHRPDL